ncbi:MAG TPA: sialidase family protein [Candidatus Thermoplasmatota archaeon]
MMSNAPSIEESMRFPVFLMVVAVAFAGCFDSGPETPEEPQPESEGSAGPSLYSGIVPLGDNTTDGSGKTISELVGGQAGHIYVSEYGPEPNIGVTSDGNVFTTAFSTIMRSQDQGATWEAVHTHGFENNDPMLWVDPWTDRVYNAPMFPTLLCASVYWSDDEGERWTNPTPACGRTAFDHQKFATGPPGPNDNPLAGVLYPTVSYLCYNGVATTNCLVSYDGGQTWPVDRPTIVNTAGFAASLAGAGPENPPSVMSECLSGQNGHPTASPDGVVVFLRTWSCVKPIFTYSTDSGLTWTNVPGPMYPGGPWNFAENTPFSIDPETAFTPDGTMYALFQSWNHRAYLARTSNLGETWEGPWDVTPPGVTSTVFAALGAGDDGRIAMAFLGAANVTGSSAAAPNDSRWHMWMVTSLDADREDPTFAAYRATPDEDPVQVGPILQGGGFDNTRNLLDFIDGAVAPDGTFYVSYTEGCTILNNCTAQPREHQLDTYRASEGAVAWLKGIPLLTENRTEPLNIG